MLIVAALDEGPLLAQAQLNIRPEATTPSLTDELIELSDQLLTEILPLYMQNEVQPAPQSEASILNDKTPTYSRKLEKQDGIIDWQKPARQLEREIRAYSGWPRSRTKLGDTNVIITQTHTLDGHGEPGTIFVDDKQLGVYCSDGILIIDSLIPAGKKEMSAQAFLAGYKLS